MKRLLITMTAVILSLGLTMSAQAAPVTITFDEAFVNPGTVGNRYDGTQISDQYAGSPWYATWADIYPGTGPYTGQDVCQPGEFNGTAWGTTNYLFIYGNNTGSGGGTQTATITLSQPSNYFSIEYRRPQASGTFDFDLYLGVTKVYDGIPITWDPILTPGWQTFTAPAVTFDKVVIAESDKSSYDNIKFNTVPLPASFLLFGSGLVPLVVRRMKK